MNHIESIRLARSINDQADLADVDPSIRCRSIATGRNFGIALTVNDVPSDLALGLMQRITLALRDHDSAREASERDVDDQQLDPQPPSAA